MHAARLVFPFGGPRPASTDMKPLFNFCFLLMPNFNMIAFTNALEVLRAANQLRETDEYAWSLASIDGGRIDASNGIALDTTAVTELARPDIVFVCGGNDVHDATTRDHLAALRQFDRQGVVLGGICTGAYVLAKAGLMAGYPCAIHWEHLFAHRETFRDIEFSKRLFVIDRNRVTCAGGLAPLHMMLELISDQVGPARVAEIADFFIVENLRNTDSLQTIPLVARLGSANRVIFDVIDIMEDNIEDPLSGDDLALRSGISVRQIQRLFRDALGTTIATYYITLRLKRARELLLQTGMQICDIATVCGFKSISNFGRNYRETFGCAPGTERKRRAAPGEADSRGR